MYHDWETSNDVAKAGKKLAEIRNPDTLPSYSRRLTQPTEKGVRLFLEVRGFGVLIVEAVGS